jgi:hypothetical protein
MSHLNMTDIDENDKTEFTKLYESLTIANAKDIYEKAHDLSQTTINNIMKNVNYNDTKTFIEYHIENPNLDDNDRNILVKYYESLTLDNATETYENVRVLMSNVRTSQMNFMDTCYFFAFLMVFVGVMVGMITLYFEKNIEIISMYAVYLEYFQTGSLLLTLFGFAFMFSIGA